MIGLFRILYRYEGELWKSNMGEMLQEDPSTRIISARIYGTQYNVNIPRSPRACKCGRSVELPGQVPAKVYMPLRSTLEAV